MKVSDNAIGFPANYNFRASTTLGIQTILSLGEGQLQGKVSMESGDGVTCNIVFKDNVYAPRV